MPPKANQTSNFSITHKTKGGSDTPGFGEAKPMVGAFVQSPIGLLRKHAATLAKARHPALISFHSCEIFRNYAKKSGQIYGPNPRLRLRQGG
ncbi:MAG: hypothetical protein KAR47_18990 [Planctomycetes bacterium]|nr:hypothetical protein [Planctomycetota bacterium]